MRFPSGLEVYNSAFPRKIEYLLVKVLVVWSVRIFPYAGIMGR